MKKEFEEDLFDSNVAEEAAEEDDGEDFSAEKGFLMGYEEELEDPNEEKAVEEEIEY